MDMFVNSSGICVFPVSSPGQFGMSRYVSGTGQDPGSCEIRHANKSLERHVVLLS